ncbi:transposase [Tropicimonas sediminicola]|uniref:Transposase n=1 Tax=Tropicimonas sediminicola TaxID=1031541 RepID=A0A239DDN7_9RHOB|nr:transposase [Tropicimonas sediminicola]SNS30515.1 Transposase [Tropicimonas sediminicola]
MARKRYSDEDILKLLREIELKLAEGNDVRAACRAVGVSDATYYIYGRLSLCKLFEAASDR